jgi:hypothetical protein
VTQITMDDEKDALLSSLNAQREHVLGRLEGLRRVPPKTISAFGWTCLGMVRHLALDLERFWFRTIVAGEPVDVGASETAEDPGGYLGGYPRVPCSVCTGRRSSTRAGSLPVDPSTSRRPGGPSSAGLTGGSAAFAKSSCA